MRTASVFFLALLLVACSNPRNKLIPGTDILLIDYGYVASPWNEDKDIHLAKVALQTEQGLVFEDVTLSCAKATTKTKHFDWSPVGNYPKIRPIYDFVCKRPWLERFLNQ